MWPLYPDYCQPENILCMEWLSMAILYNFKFYLNKKKIEKKTFSENPCQVLGRGRYTMSAMQIIHSNRNTPVVDVTHYILPYDDSFQLLLAMRWSLVFIVVVVGLENNTIGVFDTICARVFLGFLLQITEFRDSAPEFSNFCCARIKYQVWHHATSIGEHDWAVRGR